MSALLPRTGLCRWFSTCCRQQLISCKHGGMSCLQAVSGRAVSRSSCRCRRGVLVALALPPPPAVICRHLLPRAATTATPCHLLLTAAPSPICAAAAAIPGNEPPPGWPTQGSIAAENLMVRYRPELPPVLHGLSFSIRGMEKVRGVEAGNSGGAKLMWGSSQQKSLQGRLCFAREEGVGKRPVKLGDSAHACPLFTAHKHSHNRIPALAERLPSLQRLPSLLCTCGVS